MEFVQALELVLRGEHIRRDCWSPHVWLAFRGENPPAWLGVTYDSGATWATYSLSSWDTRANDWEVAPNLSAAVSIVNSVADGRCERAERTAAVLSIGSAERSLRLAKESLTPEVPHG